MKVIKMSTIVIIASNILYILRSTMIFITFPINYLRATSSLLPPPTDTAMTGVIMTGETSSTFRIQSLPWLIFYKDEVNRCKLFPSLQCCIDTKCGYIFWVIRKISRLVSFYSHLTLPVKPYFHLQFPGSIRPYEDPGNIPCTGTSTMNTPPQP